MQTTPWLLRKPSAGGSVRLYCFCYAGGNAMSFLPWQAALDPSIEVCAVQLPGRGARFREKTYSSMPPLVEALADVIRDHHTLPFAFFGHSLGGLLAFELARYCQRYCLPMPERLLVSGCDAPQYSASGGRLHTLPDEALVGALKEYNGTPPEILENRELMALALPAIRADFALVETYRYRPGPPLNMPITVLAGKRDDHVLPQHLEGWRRETIDACRIQWFEGDHFFIHTERQAVLDCIGAELADWRR